MTPVEMLEDLRDWLDEPRAAFWTDEMLMRRMHQAQQRIVRDITTENPSAFVDTVDISFVADQALYDLPLNARNGTRWIATENRVSGTPYYYVMDVALNRYLVTEADNWPYDAVGVPHVTLQGSQLRVSPTPASAVSNAIRYMYNPAYGNMLQWAVASTTSNTVTLSTTTNSGEPDYITDYGKVDPRNDIYNGMPYIITAGAGKGQYGKISDWVGLTRTFTLDSTPATSLGTTSVIAVCCPVPEDFHDVVVLMSAADGTAKSRSRVAEIQSRLYGTPGSPGKWQEMKAWFQTRNNFRLESVEPWGSSY